MFFLCFYFSGVGKFIFMNVLVYCNISYMEVSGIVEVNDCLIGREINVVLVYV